MLHNKQMTTARTINKHPAFIMKMVTDRADAMFAQMVGAQKMTAPQCRVLMYLESRGGAGVSQRELEQYLGVSHTTVKGLLQRLEEKGYVRTAFDSRDGRVKHAYLTEEFLHMKQHTRDALHDFESRLMAGFSPEEMETLRSMLERIYYNITPAGAQPPFSTQQ